ncbi:MULTISPECIES: DUF2184 domain-containing protein [unclassified Pseudomonas]|uniref:DUF2184 domain-containing protein n=1 Tax=unclassified Pseudomonas TaxID=196821 RepID=UPI001AE207B4|nr:MULTISPECIES: DUF2184 domain-containing protein [unclassified Pseudomonas]HDS1695740.1 DUF2184 domain-containing protein [Pseudomonas putida]MBP2270836.1 hypothetical protein [Pseudomonas sp. BP6]MBP2284881.1 hypothetical protein [Pseudomonas sp. BP7]MBP2290221.1 hypothetical protein [Pseudomonas sp. BP7]HDS1700962.1 DUF2184 domain-containing protein [Pseudomonas putida]
MTRFEDAQAALPFVLAQGRNIETRVYQRRYPAFNYAAHVPVVTEGQPWAIGTTFFTVDTAGEAKFLSGAGTDMPFNQVTRDQASHDFAMIGSGWEWNLEEINQAALYGVNLNDTKAMSAADKVERLLNDIAMRGSTEKNWTGLLNSTIVSRTDAAATGTGSSTFWASKTVDQILADINGVLSSVRTNTSEVEWADTLRMPPDAFRDLATRRMGAGDGFMTVLEFIRRNNIYTAETGQALDIQPLREARNASQDGGGRLVAYRKDPEVVRFHLPMPRRVLAPRQKSIMGFETGIIARTGGTEIRLPGAFAYLDEITAPAA